MGKRTHRTKEGFTLVELLVVIAIIGILIGMLLPAVQAVREAARRIQCGNQVRQLSLAMLNYESAHMHLPPGIQTADNAFGQARSESGLNWYVIVFPFVEQEPLFDDVSEITDNLTNPNAAFNDPVATTVIPSIICPSCPMEDRNTVRPDSGDNAGKANYIGVWGIEVNGNSDWNDLAADPNTYDASVYSGLLFLDSEVEIGEITDGTSNTFIIAERDGAPISDGRTRAAATWCANRRAQWCNQCLGPISQQQAYVINTVEDSNPAQWNAVSSQHTGGANFGRADGSVEFVADTISGDVYEALGTKSGGEPAVNF